MRFLLLTFITLVHVYSAQADERILNFASDIAVQSDGRVLVTETIEVRSEGKQIRRGIYRDFPVVYRGRFNERIKVDFNVLSVTRDGGNEPYFIERNGNTARLYIGREDAFVQPGRIAYTITYETNRQVGHFENHDEIYWNVTGNGWAFPIDHVEARVEVPQGAEIKDTIFFTGRYGATGKDARAEMAADDSVHFETTRALQREEGLTVAVAFEKGFVAPPTTGETIWNILRDNLHLLIGVLGLIALGTYFGVIWHKVGRDPAAGPEVPRYEPPKHMSPAASNFVRSMGFRNDAFTAAVVNLAVKGALTIEKETGGYRLVRNGREPFGLFKGERALFGTLFREGDALSIKQKNHKLLRSAQKVLKRALKQEYEIYYFKTNAQLWAVGAALAVAVVLGMVIAASYFHLPFTIFGGVIAVSIVAMLGLFYYLLKAPTLLGRKAMDHIDGFRLFLSLTEKDRLNFNHPPDVTPELFERYLPYAIALGVENEWGEQFESALKRASLDPDQGYHPAWYHGGGRFRPARFASGLSHGFGTAMSAASAAPSSSSSSGFSGGSSGGGGGGGGGGGW